LPKHETCRADVEVRIEMRIGRGFDQPLSGERVPLPPLTDAEVQELIHSSAEEAIAFRRVYPPCHAESTTSYFGGLPALPARTQWPIAPSLGFGFNFLAQIDLAALPDCSVRHLLPPAGVLSFFANTDFEHMDIPERDRAAVLYFPGGPAGLGEVRPSAEVMPCHGPSYWYHYPWIDRPEEAPRQFPRWAAEPVVVRTYPERHPLVEDGQVAGRYQELWEAAQRDSLLRAFGQPIKRFWPQPPLKEIWRPDESFPYAWIFIEIFAGCLRKELSRELRGLSNIPASKWKQSDLIYDAALQDAETWIARSRLRGALVPVQRTEKGEFFDWLWREPVFRWRTSAMS
jgi:Domain of unknown function (DUF1963)